MAGVTLAWHSVREREQLCDYTLSEANKSDNFLPDKLVGDERRLMQVLINLVKNALDNTIQGRIDIKVFYDCNG